MRENVCVRESRRMRKRENEREREKENERDTERKKISVLFLFYFFPFIVDIIQFVGMCKGRGENMHIPRCLTDP